MRQLRIFLILLLLTKASAFFAQPEPYKFLIGTGVLYPLVYPSKSVSLQGEYLFMPYGSSGIELRYGSTVLGYGYGVPENEVYLETGIFVKFYHRTRLTGRNSGLYIGPDLRSSKWYFYDNGYGKSERYAAVGIRLGSEWSMGRFCLDFTTPVHFAISPSRSLVLWRPNIIAGFRF